MNREREALRRVYVLLSVVLGVFAAAPVCASWQTGEITDVSVEEIGEAEGVYGYERPVFSVRDVPRLARILGLRDDQRDAATELLTAYSDRIASASKKMNEFNEQVHQSTGYGDLPEDRRKRVDEAYEKYEDHRKKLREGVLEDLRAVLDAEQSPLWAAVDRWLLRRDRLQYAWGGLTSAGTIDVVAVVNRAFGESPQPENVASRLDEYELAIDRILREHKEEDEKLREDWKSRADDWEKMTEEEREAIQEEWEGRSLQRSRELRECNSKAVLAVLSMLEPGDRRDMIEADFYRRAVSRAYDDRERPPLERSFKEARALGTLTDEQRGRIAELERALRQSQLKEFKERFARLCEEEEKATAKSIRERRYEHDAIESGLRESDKRMVEELRAILTPEQIEKMSPPVRQVEVPTLEFDDE